MQLGQNSISLLGIAGLLRCPAGDVQARVRIAASLEHGHAAEALQHLIEAALVAERPCIAVAGEAGVNQARIDRAQPRVVDSQPRRHRRTKILHQHIGARYHAMQHGQSVGLLQVQCQRALPAIGTKEEPALACQAGREK